MCIHTNPKLHTVKGEYTNAYNPKQKRKTLNKVGHHQPSNRNNSTTKKGVLPLLKNLKTASLEKTAGIEKLRLRTHPLALDIIPFYFLVIGEVTPPAFGGKETRLRVKQRMRVRMLGGWGAQKFLHHKNICGSHPPSLWRRFLEQGWPHENKIETNAHRSLKMCVSSLQWHAMQKHTSKLRSTTCVLKPVLKMVWLKQIAGKQQTALRSKPYRRRYR